MVTVVLFLVPCIGVALETPLLAVVGQAYGKLKSYLRGCIKAEPPKLIMNRAGVGTGTSTEQPVTGLFAGEHPKKVDGDLAA